jgi:hypothetical protein
MITLTIFHDTTTEAQQMASDLMVLFNTLPQPTPDIAVHQRNNAGSTAYYDETKTFFGESGITEYPAVHIAVADPETFEAKVTRKQGIADANEAFALLKEAMGATDTESATAETPLANLVDAKTDTTPAEQEAEKSFLQKYWWALLLGLSVLGGAIYGGNVYYQHRKAM